ncbi:hypothetical protein [Deinococcus budaensis]|uniref:Putative lipid-binding transport protein (Tim44 family) n=1 Tax=Deinococcus budaensis TaxID=1665626 RepID=A0A7W8GCE8_9DEIO|nr:hypothetical protein [Deinococcus budaensis]MBB5232823.1 putative lipid-binding transport protein (Tim44 family) [Deinococcus budaensis]
MTLNTDALSRRLSWRGILAGLVMGLVSTLTIIALGLVITALTGITLTGTGIQALIWTAIAALVGAYAAGRTAVRASAPSTRNDDGIAAMTHSDASLTGLITGGLLVLLSTLLLFNAARSLLGLATNAVSSVVGTAANVAGDAAQSGNLQNGLQNFISGVNQQDVVDLIAQNSPSLNEEQVDAAANVVTNIFRRSAYDLGQQDLTTITDFLPARLTAIRNALTGESFETRLERQGLSGAQAEEVRTVINNEINRLERQTQQLADTAEQTARTAARNTGLGWLLAAGLTLLASTMGARSAATHRAIPTLPVDRR